MIANRRTNIISDRKIDFGNRASKKMQIKPIFLQYIDDNFKEFICGIIVILLGIIISIVFVNNTNDTQKEEITTYIQNFIANLKEREKYK